MSDYERAQYYAVIDASHCTDCRACVISCKDQYALNDYPPYSAAMPMTGQKWVHVENVERGHFSPGTPKVKFRSYPVFCQMCDNAPCMAAATGGAIYKRPDGIVVIDPVKSKGQKQIVDACPYGVIFWNNDSQIPQKCTWCVQRIEAGDAPRCMNACPGLTIRIGTYEQVMDGPNGAERLERVTLHPEYNAQPRVFFVGLPGTFIAGSLVDSSGNCLAGATVTCTDDAAKKVVGTTTSDAYGDFWFDPPAGSTALVKGKSYTVTITSAGKTKTVPVTLNTDTNLGDIQL